MFFYIYILMISLSSNKVNFCLLVVVKNKGNEI